MFSELLREELLQKNLSYFNKDKKKFTNVRSVYSIIFMLMAAGFALIAHNNMLFITIPFALLVGYKAPYYSLLQLRQKNDNLNAHLFPEFMNSFVALLPTSGNVYQTLVATLPYTKDPLHGALEKLIANIEDGNERAHYIDFAEHIGSSEAYMVMDMIYQFSEFGVKKDSLQEMQRYTRELDKNQMEELITKQVNNMENDGYYAIFIAMFYVLGFGVVYFLNYTGTIFGSLSF